MSTFTASKELAAAVGDLAREVAGLQADLGEGRDTPEARMFAAQASLMQALASRVMALEVQHAAEVRTRRVVVVDQDGFERVVIDTLATSGAVTVRSTEQGRYVALAVEDGASTNAQGEPVAHAGVVIAARDEIVVELEVMDVTGGAAVTKLEMQDLHTVAGSDKPEKAGSLLLDPDELQLAGFRIGPQW